MKILDATCGTKSMWFNPNHPLVTYLDCREGKYHYANKDGSGKTTINIHPDVVADWTKKLPFNDNTFDMVLFDPPHYVRSKPMGKCFAYYGYLPSDDWKQILSIGINELFRVLKQEGVFIFKWSEHSRSMKEVLNLFPYPPIFGNKNLNLNPGRSNEVFWLVFLKYSVNKRVIEG